jgi:hypothetical protein
LAGSFCNAWIDNLFNTNLSPSKVLGFPVKASLIFFLFQGVNSSPKGLLRLREFQQCNKGLGLE